MLRETYRRWTDHQAPRLGASVVFYTLLSFAPLLVLTAAVVALVFNQHDAKSGLISQARQIIGDRGAEAVNSLLANAKRPASDPFASLIAFVTLLFGASGVFTELRDALNMMWDAAFVLHTANVLLSFTVIALLFALMFKFLPAIQIAWRDVRVGAIGTPSYLR